MRQKLFSEVNNQFNAVKQQDASVQAGLSTEELDTVTGLPVNSTTGRGMWQAQTVAEYSGAVTRPGEYSVPVTRPGMLQQTPAALHQMSQPVQPVSQIPGAQPGTSAISNESADTEDPLKRPVGLPPGKRYLRDNVNYTRTPSPASDMIGSQPDSDGAPGAVLPGKGVAPAQSYAMDVAIKDRCMSDPQMPVQGIGQMLQAAAAHGEVIDSTMTLPISIHKKTDATTLSAEVAKALKRTQSLKDQRAFSNYADTYNKADTPQTSPKTQRKQSGSSSSHVAATAGSSHVAATAGPSHLPQQATTGQSLMQANQQAGQSLIPPSQTNILPQQPNAMLIQYLAQQQLAQQQQLQQQLLFQASGMPNPLTGQFSQQMPGLQQQLPGVMPTAQYHPGAHSHFPGQQASVPGMAMTNQLNPNLPYMGMGFPQQHVLGQAVNTQGIPIHGNQPVGMLPNDMVGQHMVASNAVGQMGAQPSGGLAHQATGQVQHHVTGQLQHQPTGQVTHQATGQLQHQASGQVGLQHQAAGQITHQNIGQLSQPTAGHQAIGQLTHPATGQVSHQTTAQLQHQAAGQLAHQATTQLPHQTTGQLPQPAGHQIPQTTTSQVSLHAPGALPQLTQPSGQLLQGTGQVQQGTGQVQQQVQQGTGQVTPVVSALAK